MSPSRRARAGDLRSRDLRWKWGRELWAARLLQMRWRERKLWYRGKAARATRGRRDNLWDQRESKRVMGAFFDRRSTAGLPQ